MVIMLKFQYFESNLRNSQYKMTFEYSILLSMWMKFYIKENY